MPLGTRVLLGLLAALAAQPALAQIYRWVDERGVVNYSNLAPQDPAGAQELVRIEDRVSVYTPDEALARAVRELRLAPRAPETAPAAEAPSSAPAREALPAWLPHLASDPCAGERAALCAGTYAPFLHPAPLLRPRSPPFARIPQIRLPSGRIAGAVVGPEGFIPGHSGVAPEFRPTPVRPSAPER